MLLSFFWMQSPEECFCFGINNTKRVGNSDSAFHYIRNYKSLFFLLNLIRFILTNDRLLKKQELRTAICFVFCEYRSSCFSIAPSPHPYPHPQTEQFGLRDTDVRWWNQRCRCSETCSYWSVDHFSLLTVIPCPVFEPKVWLCSRV